METIEPSFKNFDSLMKAADIESKELRNDEESSQIIGDVSTTSNPAESICHIPTITGEDIKSALNDTNLAAMLNRMANNPNELEKMIRDTKYQMTPEMMEQARKLAEGGHGDHIMKEMRRRGMDPKAMKSKLKDQQKSVKGLGAMSVEMTKKVVLITRSRKIKTKSVPTNSANVAISGLLRVEDPNVVACSRLAQGPLSGNIIKLWYDSANTTRNRLASKLAGFTVGGEIVIESEDGDVTEVSLNAAASKLK